MRIPLALLAAATLCADVVEQGPKDSPPSGLLAGVARASIAPPVGIAHLNWGSQTHVEAEAIDPAGMFATAIVLSDGKQKFAMVDVDALFVRGAREIIERASQRTGIPAAHIRLAATHTHAGPGFSGGKGPVGTDSSLYEGLIARHDAAVADKIVGAIIEANASLVPAHLGAARGEGTININRRVRAKDGRPAAVGRNPEGTVDRELIVFRIDDAQGKPLAVLVNFQCHGTVLAYENKTISPDWIGMTRKVIEDSLPGALALYFQGAAGDQGPMEGFTGDLAVPHRLGRILGHQAAALALSIETVRREPFFEGFVESTAYQAKQHWRVKGPRDATLRFATVTVQAPPRTYTREELARLERQVADAEAAVKKLGPNADRWEKHQAEARLRRFSDLLRSWRNPRTETLPVDVQALRIGEYALVAMPGEPFSGIGAAVKKASPFAVTMFCGYSSGSGGDYMPIASEYEHGGYEVERSPYGTGAADLVIREAQALLRKLKD